MKINNKIFKAGTVILLLLSLVLGYFRIDMLNSGKIDALGLYTHRSAGNVFNSAVFILLALTVAFAFILSKSLFAERKTNKIMTVSSVLCMLFLIIFAISGIHELLSAPKTILSANNAVGLDFMLVLEVVFALASAVFFLTDTLKGRDSHSKSSLTALFPVLYLAVRTIDIFMDITTQINSSSRAFTTLFLAVTMMFFISEAEMGVPLASFEKTPASNSKRIAKYVGFGTASGVLAVIFIVAPLFTSSLPVSELVICISDITLALFAVIRVFSVKPE